MRRHDIGMSLSGPLLAELDTAAALTHVADAVFVTVWRGLEVRLVWVRLGHIRLNLDRFGSIRLGHIRLSQDRLGSVRLG